MSPQQNRVRVVWDVKMGVSSNEAADQPMVHMKGVVFIRPVRSSIDKLMAHLKTRPKYKEYYVCKSI